MFQTVKLPPGVVRNGTDLESANRFFATNLVRWKDGATMAPMGGWRLRSADSDAAEGKPRAVLPWRDNSGDRWIAVATNSHLYVQSAGGVLADITPVGFTPGLADSTVRTGFGAGPFGKYAFGTPRPDIGTPQPPSMATLDLWNDKLIFCLDSDKGIYEWPLTGIAAAVTNAPEAEAIVVSQDGFLFALKDRSVKHCDQADNTVWTPTDLNQARDKDLQTNGKLMCGSKVKGGTLLLTTTDAWLATYIGFPLVHGYERVGTGCGIISRGAAVEVDQQTVWMGQKSFFLYNGFVQPVPCDVQDYVFTNINTAQVAKITSGYRAAYGEVWWHYPSANSNEVDSYVIWNTRLNAWYFGMLDRTCSADAGVFDNPLMVSSDGLIYEHEVGFSYDGAAVYATSGPFQLGNGERRMEVQRIIPDVGTAGDVTLTFLVREWPNGSDTTFGPYALTEPTDVMFQAGVVKLRYDFAARDGRVGVFRLDLIGGDPL